MSDCERVLYIEGKFIMAVGSTATFTSQMLYDEPILRNTCECGTPENLDESSENKWQKFDRGADCCNDNEPR